MRYMVDYCGKNFEVSVRVDANRETKIKKIVQECMKQTNTATCRYWVEYPNIWVNGAVGTLCVNGEFVGIRKSGSETYMYIQ